MDFSKFKGIIFDLDGTLINSSQVWSDIDRRFLAKRGFAVPNDYFKAVSTMNFTSAAEYTITRFDLKETIEEIAKEWYDMAFEEYAHNIFLKGGAYNFLSQLRAKDVKIALATASSKELYEAVLRNNGVYDLFDFFAHHVSQRGVSPGVHVDVVGGVRGHLRPGIHEVNAGRLGHLLVGLRKLAVLHPGFPVELPGQPALLDILPHADGRDH